MRVLISTIAVAAVATLALTSQASSAPEPRPGTVLVLGDSITSQYTDDPGDPIQGWWSILAERRGLTPIISAQAGGGLIKKGYGCAGTGVRERSTAVINRVRPDEIWLAIGVNDLHVCISGHPVPIAPSFRAKAATAYFAGLAQLADQLGIPRANIYVTTPWGTRDIRYRHDVVVTFQAAAVAAGLTYINLPRLGTELTRDTAHPNTAGNRYIADFLGSRMAEHVSHPGSGA